MTAITLTNDFHNTSVSLRPKAARSGALYISAGQVRKARRTLCGISGCECGDAAGCRPAQVEDSGSLDHMYWVVV